MGSGAPWAAAVQKIQAKPLHPYGYVKPAAYSVMPSGNIFLTNQRYLEMRETSAYLIVYIYCAREASREMAQRP